MKAKLLILCLSVASLFLGDKLNAQDLYFTPDIINILSDNNCLGCHGTAGGLNLNTYAQALAGGNSCGPAFVAGDPDSSPLVNKIDPSVPVCSGGTMPPSGSVSAEDIASIRLWIEQGALETAPTVCEDLVISAYVEGSSQNKCIELFNGTENDIDLATYTIDVYSNGNTEANTNFALEGTIAAGGYFLVCHGEADLPGITVDFAANLNFNGNDAVALNNGTANVDVVGQIGINPEAEAWINGDCSTENSTLIKLADNSLCGFGANDGTSDFDEALGSLYTCFPSNDVTQLNSYVEPIACPTLSLAEGATAEITACAGDEITLDVVVTEATADDIVWSDGSTGTSISTGVLTSDCEDITLTFTASVAAGTVDGCEEVSVTYTVNVFPDLTAGAELSIDDESCTVSIINACESANLTFTVNDGDVQEGSSYTAAAGENSSVNFFIGDDACGNTATFSTDISCPDVPTPCPTLSLPDDVNAEITACAGDEITLDVVVTEATADDVLWSDGSTGTSISTGILTSDCEGSNLTFTASVAAGTVEDCEEVSVTYTITVLPDLTAGAELSIDDANCTISLINACEAANVTFNVNDGDVQEGSSYTAAAGENSSVNFFIGEDACGNTATFSTDISCPDVPTPCPTLSLPDDVNAEITACAGDEITLDVVVTEATADDVLWSDGSTGTSISTGILTSDCEGSNLTFTASVAAGTVEDCEEVSVTYTITVLPDLTAGAELSIDDANCTISLINACEAANVTFNVNDGDVQEGSSYTAAAGENSSVNFFIGEDACGNTATFSSDISCEDVATPCAELSAVGETSLTICAGESIDLNVAVANGDASTVSWSNDAAGATTTYIAAQTTDCDGFTDVISATYVDNTGGDCPETISIDFTITVLPNPSDVVSLEINTQSCSINLLNACDGFEVSYVVDGGEAQAGTTYQAFASSFSEVTFTATGQCGTATLDAILDCETVPIELLGNINGYVLDNGNLLKWATASEYNNAFFTLSSSADGKNFETIATITGAGTSNFTQNYEFLDRNAKAGTTYYQLTQTDFDGTSKDLGIINLRRGSDNLSNLNVYPIPSSDVVNLNFDSAISQDLTVKIYDLTGKLVAEKIATTIVGNNVLPININTYIAGTYFITINNESVNVSAKFVKY